MARSKLVRKKGGPKLNSGPVQEMPSDDEVEKFHKSRDKLSLNMAGDEEPDLADEEEVEDEAVLALSDDGSEDEDDEDDSGAEDGGRLSQRELQFVRHACSHSLRSSLLVWCGFCSLNSTASSLYRTTLCVL